MHRKRLDWYSILRRRILSGNIASQQLSRENHRLAWLDIQTIKAPQDAGRFVAPESYVKLCNLVSGNGACMGDVRGDSHHRLP